MIITEEIITLARNAFNDDYMHGSETSDGAWKAALEAVFDRINSADGIPTTEEKPLDDGWILHTGDTQPVGDDVEVYIHRKYEDKPDTDHSTLAKDLWWGVVDNDAMIIAYRIIPEPENSSAKAESDLLNIAHKNGLAPNTIYQVKEPVSADKPTPKQTLLEYCIDIKKKGWMGISNIEYIELISEYLEERLK